MDDITVLTDKEFMGLMTLVLATLLGALWFEFKRRLRKVEAKITILHSHLVETDDKAAKAGKRADKTDKRLAVIEE